MFNIMKNTWKLFRRDKEYFSMVLFEPIMMLLMFSFLLSFQNRITLNVTNLDQGALGSDIIAQLEAQDGISLQTSDEKTTQQKVADGSSEIGIVIEKEASKKAATGSVAGVHTLQLENSPNAAFVQNVIRATVADFNQQSTATLPVTVNSVKKKGIAISASLGFLIFKLITSGSILGQLLIRDRNSGIRGRIFLSNTSTFSYLAGLVGVFLINACFSSLSYFICATLFRFDFGMQHSLMLLPILFCASILSAALYSFIAAFINNQQLLWYIAVLVFLPTSILSGAMVPFKQMPEMMQKIGALFPQRWLTQAVENLQQGQSFTTSFSPVIGVLIFSLLLFILASLRLKRPIALQKT